MNIILNEALREHAHYLIATDGPGIQKQDYFKGSETAPCALEAIEKIEPYLNKENGYFPYP